MAPSPVAGPRPLTGPRVVLFDFDGVVLRGDAFAAFVRARLTGVRWRKALGLALCCRCCRPCRSRGAWAVER